MGKLLIALVLGVLGVLIHASLIHGGAPESSFSGSVSVGRTRTTFDMAGGFAARGKLGDLRRYADVRNHRFVPAYFGEIIAVTAHGEDAVLWYRDGSGIIRNVVAPTANRRQFLFETQTSHVRQISH